MKIKYHLFGSVFLQAKGHKQSDEFEIKKDTTVTDLICMLGLDPQFPMGVVINGVITNKSSILQNQDEVKLISFASGG